MDHASDIIAELDIGLVTAAEIEAAGQVPFDFTAPEIGPEPLPGHQPLTKADFALMTDPHEEPAREPFGRWLLTQKDRGDWIDPIAAAARKDPMFPKNGTPEEVKDHLRKMGADGDAFEAIDDAELDWASL